MREWFRTEIARAPRAYAALLIVAVSFLAYANTLRSNPHSPMSSRSTKASMNLTGLPSDT